MKHPATMTASSTRPSCFVALMYHNVIRAELSHPSLPRTATKYFVAREAFHRQLCLLHELGAKILDWDELDRSMGAEASHHRGDGEASRQPKILLTFDDGWRDCVEVGGPELERAKATAVLFVCTDLLDRPNFLTKRELRGVDRKQFIIGSHARSHRMLSTLSDAEIREELGTSKQILEDLTGCEVSSISIPNGAVDHRVRHTARACGYRALFDSEIRVNRFDADPMTLGRIAITDTTSLADIRRYVDHKLGRERARRAALQLPKRLLGLRRYDAVRRRLFGERESAMQ